jgi:hypothetical protein
MRSRTVAKVENIMDKLGQEIETQKEIQNALSSDMIGTGLDEVSGVVISPRYPLCANPLKSGVVDTGVG